MNRLKTKITDHIVNAFSIFRYDLAFFVISGCGVALHEVGAKDRSGWVAYFGLIIFGLANGMWGMFAGMGRTKRIADCWPFKRKRITGEASGSIIKTPADTENNS